MKRKIVVLISGMILLAGVGMYLAQGNSKIAAEENKIQGPLEKSTNTTTSTPSNSPSLFANTFKSVLNNDKFTPMGLEDTLPKGYTFFAKPNIYSRFFRINKNTGEKLEELKRKKPDWGVVMNYVYFGDGEAIYFSNIGEYQGKVIDLSVALEDGFTGRVYYSNFGEGRSHEEFLSMDQIRNPTKPKDNVKITFKYFDHNTGDPVNVKGVFNFLMKSSLVGGYRMLFDANQSRGLFVTKDSVLRYELESETENNTLVSGVTPTVGVPKYYLTSIFEGNTYTVNSYMGTNANVPLNAMKYSYDANPVARIATPEPTLRGSLESDGSKHQTSFDITINQNIPLQSKDFKKYGSFDFVLPPTNDLYKFDSMKVITTQDGTDVSSNFTLSGDKITVNPTFLNKDTFYGETYEIRLSYKLDTTKNYFSLYQDGYLVMPFDAVTQTTDLDGTQLSNETTAKIKWDYQLKIAANDVDYSQGDVKRLKTDPEAFKKRILTDSQAVGKNLDLNTEISVAVGNMAIDSKVGTYPVTLSTQDGDITLTKKINVNVKAVPPKVALPENGTRVVSSKGVPYTVNGSVSDEDSENTSLFITIDSGQPTTIWDKKVNTELNQPIDFTYDIPGAQLLELGDHVVKVYAKDSEDNQSEIAQFTLDIRGYLAFKELPPEKLDFDTTKINSKGTYAKLSKSVDFSVEDYRGSNTSWKLVGSLTSELTDTDTDTTIVDGIIYRDENGEETPFSADATVKLSTGKATSSKVLFPIKWRPTDQGIFIKLPPDVKQGRYKGSIEMSLVDAP